MKLRWEMQAAALVERRLAAAGTRTTRRTQALRIGRMGPGTVVQFEVKRAP